jgi:Zn-dependent peptidase ImmA (M78 family)
MLEQHTQKDIEKVSYEILKGSKSLDVFPTPINKIVEYAELVVRSDIDVSQVHEGYISKTTDALTRALSKLRGALDRKQRTIYLDLSQMKTKQGFVKLHEVGHDVLPWQKKIHTYLEDDDDSLGGHTNEEFEAEANFFASATLFQQDRFIDELNKYSLSLDSSIQLSKQFGASIHATLRRYVECSKNRCALLVLENISAKGTVPKCNLRDKFQSAKFSATFGELVVPNEFGYTWDFVPPYYHGKKMKIDGSITLTTENGEADFNYHFFCNSYNAFVFLFPYGEKKSSRTKIIITDSVF